MAILFKTDRQKTDWGALSQRNPDLYSIGNCLSVFCSVELNKDVVITDVFRTKEEFDALYAATPVDKRPSDSPHCHYNAFDIRSSVFTPKEIERILAFLNCFRNPSGKPTAIFHSIAGNVNHFHVQRVKA